MARLASQSKGVFYATPVEEMNRIVKGLEFKGEQNEFVNILDPAPSAFNGSLLIMYG